MQTKTYRCSAVAPISETKLVRCPGEGRLPFAETPLPASFTFHEGLDDEGRKIVGFFQVGGTDEQFQHHALQFERYQHVHGRAAGTAFHIAPR